MKRCPQCYEAYDDDQRFCEVDGQQLLADPTLLPRVETVTAAPSTASSVWPTAALGTLVGVVIGAAIFAAGSFLSARNSNELPANNRAAAAPENIVRPRQVVASSSVPTLETEPSPSPEPEPSAQAEASPAITTENKTVSVQLNQGPISTGEKTKSTESASSVQTVIEMNDGSTLDVDAAWEDKQGIWYRRSGLVSFVESSRVRAITTRNGTKAADVSNR